MREAGRSVIETRSAQMFPMLEQRDDPPEGWAWCFVDEVVFDLGDDVTPQVGPIPRFG